MPKYNLRQSLRRLDAWAILIAVFCTLASGAGATGTYVLFDPPDSVHTESFAINTAGDVAGDFTYEDKVVCFFRSSDGQIQTFTVDESSNCVASGINDDGTITGRIVDNLDPECVRTGKGFSRASDGTTTSFGYTTSASTYAVALGINKTGNIVGYYRDDSGDSCVFRGFFRDHGNGVLTDIPVQRAEHIYANGLNDNDVVTGNYRDFDGVTHGFIIKQGKMVGGKKCGKGCQTVNFQGADKHKNTGGAFGINSTKDITGYFTDPEGINHGFIRFYSNGNFTQVDHQNAGTQGTFAVSINDSESIAGYYYDPAGTIRGFVRTAADAFLDVQCPGDGYTEPHGINAAGQVTGQCAAADGKTHGFIWTPPSLHT